MARFYSFYWYLQIIRIRDSACEKEKSPYERTASLGGHNVLTYMGEIKDETDILNYFQTIFRVFLNDFQPLM